jgi:hypothetical protein
MKSGLMRLDVVKEKRTYFGNTIIMKTLCMHRVRKIESELVQLLVCPVLSRIVFPMVPPSLMMIVWSSVISQHSEPKGEFRDDYDDGIVHIPQPPPAPNIQNEEAGWNIIPEEDPPVHAPEGAAIPPAPKISTRTHWHACHYPPAKWMRGADGKLECVNLSELKQQKAMGKLN